MGMDPSEWEKERIRSMLVRLMELGIGAVYGGEDEEEGEKSVDCPERVGRCRSVCCTFHFALTKSEAKRGDIRHDPERPFFIKREKDGYCLHLDRRSLRCAIWEKRPLRCRKYDCRQDKDVWEDAGAMRIRPEILRAIKVNPPAS